MLPPRSALADWSLPTAFTWAVGIEDTVITAPWPGTGRTLDEYALTDHTGQWREDLARMQALGVRAVRYGVPWHRVQTSPTHWDWAAAEPLDRLLDLGIDPIVDCIHYGLPPWLPLAWGDPSIAERAAEWAYRLADRYRGRIRWWTPVNEPRITAWYCGRLGWWPPNWRGWSGCARLFCQVASTTRAMAAAIRAVDDENVLCHVDATDLYASPDPSLAQEVAFRQELVFLALDLASGRVGPTHPLAGWLTRWVGPDAAERLGGPPAPLDVIGINLYPLFSRKRLTRDRHGQRRMRMPYARADIIPALARLYWERYQRPLFITETATMGSVERRLRWLRDSVAAVAATRAAGIPLCGYTWWPMFSLITWAYRQGTLPPERYLASFGLWDLEGPSLTRRPTPLVDAFRALVAQGAAPVGTLAPVPEVAHVP